MKLFISSLAAICLAAGAQAATLTADTVIAYFEPDDGGTDAVRDGIPNGLSVGGREYEVVDLQIGQSGKKTVATDGNPGTYVSLPVGTFIVLGFSQGFVFDGVGDDLFVDETGSAAERAAISVSSDFGKTFIFLDNANGANQTNSFDFADYDFLPDDLRVNAVKVEGLTDGGSSPGFDLTFVRGLEGSVVEEPQNPVVPLPAGMPLLLGGLAVLGILRRRKS